MNSSGLVRAALVSAFAVAIVALSPQAALGQSGYKIGERSQQQMDQGYGDQQGGPQGDSNAPATDESGPARMARFSFISGNVTWRASSTDDWDKASDNIPLREGAQIWVGDGGRAEVQFDDGSAVRLGSGGVVTLQTMFSDTRGEYTELKMNDGLASLDLRTTASIFQIDTPRGDLKAAGPAMVRLGVDEEVELGVRDGNATFEGPQGKIDLKSGDYLDVADDKAPYQLQDLPLGDAWDQFTDERHALMSKEDTRLPQTVRHVAGDLDQYGDWHDDPDYGNVWTPDEPTGWSPYTNGNWTWVEPWGWTWVGAEPWGWAPYHYGTWVRRHWGWSWVPGPAFQYWSPGVVSFTSYNGDYCWSPLAPWEVAYPSPYGLGIFGTGWCDYFSIGFCGLFVADNDRFCRERRWDNHWVNSWRYHFYGDRHGFDWRTQANARFSPANARFGAGGFSPANEFGYGRVRGLTQEHAGEAFRYGHEAVTPEARPSGAFGNGLRTPEEFRTRQDGIFQRPTYSDPALGFRGVRNGADAAQRARTVVPQTRGNNFGGGYPRTNYSPNPSYGGNQNAPRPTQNGRGGWSVPDHGGWTHQHSGGPSSSGGGNGGGGGNGRRGGR